MGRARRQGRTAAGIALAASALAAACAGEDWPTLATPAPEAPPPLLSAVAMPPPAPWSIVEPFEPAEADAFLAALPGALADIESRIVNQQAAFEAARDRLAASAGANAYRTAQFEMSRLSRIETEIASLRRSVERLLAAGPDDRDRVLALRSRLGAIAAEFSTYLAQQRRRFALGAPTDG